jgi:hypothetical protein
MDQTHGPQVMGKTESIMGLNMASIGFKKTYNSLIG